MELEYYENEENLDHYTKFTPAHDGALLIEVLSEHLPEDAAVLELGMGPGKDFKLLSRHYRATGSDLSRLFLQRYREQDPAADLLHLDARTLETERRRHGGLHLAVVGVGGPRADRDQPDRGRSADRAASPRPSTSR